MAQLRQNLRQFDQVDARLVLVSMGTPEQSAAFARKAEMPGEVISDPDRRLYLAFGLTTASIPRLFRPAVAFKALAAMAQGHPIRLPVGDIRQLPGVFIIDTRGRIVFRHVGKDPADHPEVETLLAALNSLSSRKPGAVATPGGSRHGSTAA